MMKLYNFKVLNTFRFMAQTVFRMKEDGDFNRLQFPLIELIKGYSLVYPSLSYLPLRLHLCRLLIKIKRDLGVSIPMLHIYSRLLSCKYFMNQKSYNKGVETNFDSELCVKIAKPLMNTQAIWDSMFKELGDIIIQDLAIESDYIYSPEYMFICYKVLSAYRKASKDLENKNLFKKIVKNLLSFNTFRSMLSGRQ